MKACLAAIFIVLMGCAAAKSEPAPQSPLQSQQSKYAEVVARITQFTNRGFVVSLGGNDHHGDSLIFTGLALYGLPCAEGEPLARGIEGMLASGTYYRYPGDSDSVSMDQLLGMYRGIAARVRRCGEKDRWAAALRTAPAVTLPAGFDYVRQRLMAVLGVGGDPAGSLRSEMEASAASWTATVNATHAAAYRVHLSLIALQAVEEMGTSVSRAAFCSASRGVGIATVENWCGREGIASALDRFQYDIWEYHWQRGAWESPDGDNSPHPAVDYLVAYADMVGGVI